MCVRHCLAAAFVVAGLAAVGPNPSAAQESLPRLIKRIQPAVVTILGYKDDTKKFSKQGTGFFINKEGHLVTNYHVLSRITRAEVKTSDGATYPLKMILAEDPRADIVIALADLPKEPPHFLQFTREIPEVGEDVVVVGSPLGLELTVTEGVVSAVRRFGPWGGVIQISAAISPGSSGSPVVNRKGEVVGVATFFRLGGQNLNFAIPAGAVLALRAGSGRTLPLPEPEEPQTREFSVAEILMRQGLDHFKAGNYDQAAEAFKEVMRLRPNYARGCNMLGLAYKRLGRLEDAELAYKQAIKLEPEYYLPYYNLGYMYFGRGLHQQAAKTLKQAIRLKPDDAWSHFIMGKAQVELGERSAALDEYKILLTLDRKLAEELFNLIYK